MSEARCETCRFWKVERGMLGTGRVNGECRRRAPVRARVGSSKPYFVWTTLDDWCGEYERRLSESDAEAVREATEFLSDE